MLYKEKLNLHDRMKLFFMKDDLNELENYLSKRNYANLEELNIIVRKVSFMRTNDIGIEIKFKLIFNDQKNFIITVTEDTREAYIQFLEPFIKYHVKINDPSNLIDGLKQPLRLTEYFIRHQGRLLAVYKDAQERIFYFSPYCPHLKCVVQYNEIDNTWNCPCHGSIFDCHGKLVSGPATKDRTMTWKIGRAHV